MLNTVLSSAAPVMDDDVPFPEATREENEDWLVEEARANARSSNGAMEEEEGLVCVCVCVCAMRA